MVYACEYYVNTLYGFTIKAERCEVSCGHGVFYKRKGIFYEFSWIFVLVVFLILASVICLRVVNCHRAVYLELGSERVVAHVAEILCHGAVGMLVGVAKVFLYVAIEHLLKGFLWLVYREFHI